MTTSHRFQAGHLHSITRNLLVAAGTSDHIADDVAGYVDLAVHLAGDQDRLAELRSNLRKDVAASPLLYDTKVFRAVVNIVGPDKVLYGSDYPLRLYPDKLEKPDFSTFLGEIRDAELTEEELKKILGDNASLLLGLDG